MAILAVLAAGIGTASSWHRVDEVFDALVPFLAVGFAAQVLLGALSYLVPVALGGGPAAVRAANRVLDRGGSLRLGIANVGLVLCVLPAPGAVRLLAAALALLALASTLPLLLLVLLRRGPRRDVLRPGARRG